MTRRQQWLLVGGVVAVIGTGLYAATVVSRDHFRVGVGVSAPAFSAFTLDQPAATRSLAEYDGRVVLLNVWATVCEPCKDEMPTMEKLHREFGKRGLSIVAVSVDAPNYENIIRKFVTDLGLTFNVLYDPTGALESAYQTRGYPETFIIDRKGVITRKVWFKQDWASPDNRALIEHLINEPGEPIPAPPKSAAIVVRADTGRLQWH